MTARARALGWIAHGLTAANVSGSDIAPVVRQLETEGWTPAAARDALAAANDQAPDALRRRPGRTGGSS